MEKQYDIKCQIFQQITQQDIQKWLVSISNFFNFDFRINDMDCCSSTLYLFFLSREILR